MCTECRFIVGHDARCPNAEDKQVPEYVAVCDECCRQIQEGEEIAKNYKGETMCSRCMKELDRDELIDFFATAVSFA